MNLKMAGPEMSPKKGGVTSKKSSSFVLALTFLGATEMIISTNRFIGD
jgi:hypothetical protein